MRHLSLAAPDPPWHPSRVLRRCVLGLAVLLVACEDDTLAGVPPAVDAGFPDVGFAPDAEPVDAGFAPDAAAPDAEVPPPPAREPIYIHTGDTLYSYDTAANTAVPVGQFHTSRDAVTDMADIAIDRDGRMFGGGVDRTIYLINPLTAECEARFDTDDRVHGMTFLPDGNLVMAGEFVRVVDPNSGRVIRELVDNQGFKTSGDIVGLPDGFLYWTVRGDARTGDLVVRIDPRTGATRRLGGASAERLYGLGYADGVLFGFSADGLVVELEPRDGRVIREQMLGARWWGATTNPVVW
jgi:hypothetical protein